MARVGRPRIKVDRQEFFGVFARMSAAERASALEVMTAVHGALSPVQVVEPEAEPEETPEPPK